jgi:hypothetical protein
MELIIEKKELPTRTCDSKPVQYSAYHILALTRTAIQKRGIPGYKASIRARKTALCLPPY